jgi:hypothetical protein
MNKNQWFFWIWVNIFIAFCSYSFNCLGQNLVQSGKWQLSGNGAWYGGSGGADGGSFMGPNTLNLSEWYQDLPTTVGQSYQLSFYLRGSYPAQQSPPFAMDVYWNSEQVNITWDTFSSDWIYESLNVVGGPSSQSVLGFSDPDPTDSAFSDVSVVAIPEPSIFTLVSSAVIAMLCIYRLKR